MNDELLPVQDLRAAMALLVDVHTRDDDLVGFVVNAPPLDGMPWISYGDYIDAWRKVRMALSRNVNPEPTPTPPSEPA
jgi:hypothetical protein